MLTDNIIDQNRNYKLTYNKFSFYSFPSILALVCIWEPTLPCEHYPLASAIHIGFSSVQLCQDERRPLSINLVHF